MRYLLALLLLTLSAISPAEAILQSGTPLAARERHCGSAPVVNQRKNLAISIGPSRGQSDLKLRMAIKDLPVRKGEILEGALIGQGGAGVYVYSIVAPTSLPPGLSLNSSTGAITGTPTTVGHYSFLAKVQDSQPAQFQCTLSINVLPPLVVVAGDPPPAENGVSYGYQFLISGATGSVTWALTDGAFPVGLSIDADGLLSGIPNSSGISNFVVTATDGGSGDSIEVHCSIFTYAAISSASIFPLPKSYAVNTFATVIASGFVPTGGVPPVKFNITGLPSWVTAVTPVNDTGDFGSRYFNIEGVPDTVGVISFTYVMTDAIGQQSTTKTFQFVVVDPVGAPTSATDGHVALFDGATGKLIKDSGVPASSVSIVTKANVPTSATLSHTINRYTAANVHGTAPASPADFEELEIAIEDASYTGCTFVANSGQTVNGGASFSFDILPAIFRFRYNLAATNWFVDYYRIGTI